MTDVMSAKKTKTKKQPYPLPVELIDQMLAQVHNKGGELILGEAGLEGKLKKMLVERMLTAELNHHLADEEAGNKNHRNGTSSKRVLTPGGELQLDIPHDRLSSFEPKLLAKRLRRMPGFDDHVISMSARGMSVREIQAHLLVPYGTEVPPELISIVTDEVLDAVAQWQQRPLEAMYLIIYFDALRLEIRDEGTVKNKAVYLALGPSSPIHRRCAKLSHNECH